MQMDKKQTMMLALTVLAFFFLGYQVYQLISSDLSTSAQPTSSALVTPSLTTPTMVSDNHPVVAEAKPFVAATHRVEPEVTSTQVAVTPASSSDAHVEKSDALPAAVDHEPLVRSQKQYLQMLNQYELLKMQRQLLQEQAAMAQARLQIAMLNDQARKLSGNSAPTDNLGVVAPEQTDEKYQLSYIDQQNGQWSASVYHNGVYQVVNVGSWLSDGYQITKISRDGVTIQKNSEQELISFNGMVKLPSVVVAKNVEPAKNPVVDKPKPQQYTWHTLPLADLSASAEAVAGDDRPLIVKHHKTPSDPAVSIATKTETQADSLQDSGTKKTILAIDKNHYTIQLIGSYNKEVVESFATNNNIDGQTYLFSVDSNGKPWYMLILGDFSDMSQAKMSLMNLSKPLQFHGPWIRQYSEIQNMLK